MSLTAAASTTTTTTSTIPSGSGSSLLGGGAAPHILANAAQFREIHKNTWLKRLTAEGKKITVGPKKSERSWVVFCVHDDTEALLEGYAEPRQAASHSPEWIVSMQDTLHISHALIPNSHEFEFVVTLSNEVVRFHAMSWEIMQEWVETLRSKLREMKILSPRENLYTKLPEIRAPLLPTRDPTSPLPAPPPVPAALVPGVERVVPQQSTVPANESSDVANNSEITTATSRAITNAMAHTNSTGSNSTSISTTTTLTTAVSNTLASVSHTAAAPLLTAMSNTLTQNLLNMLSDPISAYSEHLSIDAAIDDEDEDDDETTLAEYDDANNDDVELCSERAAQFSSNFNDEFLSSLLRKSSVTPGTSANTAENSVRLDIGSGHRASAEPIKNLDNLLQCERLIPRPHTSRSLSAGAADKFRRQNRASAMHHNDASNPLLTKCGSNNITELEISSEPTNHTATTTTTVTAAVNNSDNSCTTTTRTAADSKTNITIIQVSTNANNSQTECTNPPKLPMKNTSSDIFKFPETLAAAASTTKTTQHDYKSNVQIIPSNLNNSNTIQVLLDQTSNAASSVVANQYSTPVKKLIHHNATAMSSSSVPANVTAAVVENHKVTTVHVAGDATKTSSNAAAVAVYGTCYTTAVTQTTSHSTSTPKLPKKIFLSANTSGITNITVNNAASNSHHSQATRKPSDIETNAAGENGEKHNAGNIHYEKVFLSSSIPIALPVTSTQESVAAVVAPISPKLLSAQWNSPRRQEHISSSMQTASQTAFDPAKSTVSLSPAPANSSNSVDVTKHNQVNNRNKSIPSTPISQIVGGSPALPRRRFAVSPITAATTTTTAVSNQLPLPMRRPPFLKRGLTEAVITTRPSRKDFHVLKTTAANTKSNISSGKTTVSVAPSSTNNNGEAPGTSASNANPRLHAAVNRTNSESIEQRRRSSSTSDAQAQRNARGTNNNESPGHRNAGGGNGAALRIQQPPQPFRSAIENGVGNGGVSPPTTSTTSPAAKRMTLREQQVMQLRREIMHPGGVRLQLRRKDCVGSIAWVDAFGAVWVAGWKQKEHPVLYNALHIGDQLLSIAGATISNAAEANKTIRNANTLFVEVLVRRIPFGRGYAIRREREGQCLGLIRDGNTSTIVDVVPNSLAARHGLPPKAQSCDGSTLTFWVLTEINGRPLNLFFKENEIRDRLNSVGRDISILVQPADLITKLKKQLKSLRGHKDYLVQ